MIRKNPDVDYTEGGLQIMAGELTKKMAQAQEEWDYMPLDKAGPRYGRALQNKGL
nr:hypothetical protein [Paenibacillus melissococcoides]